MAISSPMASVHREFLFLISSARVGGNGEQLARLAAASLAQEVRQRWVRLSELSLPAFEDHRHEGSGVYDHPEGAGRILLEATLAATDLVFIVPLYWYSVPASAKLYLDHWSAWMRVPGVDFRGRMAGKTMWVITVMSDEDESFLDPLLGTLRLTAQYMSMRWGGALVRYGNRPGDALTDRARLNGVDTFFTAPKPADTSAGSYEPDQ
jgi:multimeric flavodoxin WrbA